MKSLGWGDAGWSTSTNSSGGTPYCSGSEGGNWFYGGGWYKGSEAGSRTGDAYLKKRFGGLKKPSNPVLFRCARNKDDLFKE